MAVQPVPETLDLAYFIYRLYAMVCFRLKQQEFISYKSFASPWRDLSLACSLLC